MLSSSQLSFTGLSSILLLLLSSTLKGNCAPKDDKNNCSVIHGTITLYLKQTADTDKIRYNARSIIFEAISNGEIASTSLGVTSLTYLGPSFQKPESELKNGTIQPTSANGEPRSTIQATGILIILGSCSSVILVGTVCLMARKHNRETKRKKQYDFNFSDDDDGGGVVTSHIDNESSSDSNTSDSSIESPVADESWDADQQGLSVIMEATNEASSREESASLSLQMSNSGWTTDEDSTTSTQVSVISGFSDMLMHD